MSPSDPLAAALLPVLLHRLGNAGQLLTALRAVLGLEGGERALHERADDLATTAREVEELGWALAALASASGADLLLARREPRGAELLVELAGDALRRARAAELVGPPLPRVAPSALEGWQVPWGIASLLFGDAARAPRSARLEYAVERGAEELSIAATPSAGEASACGWPRVAEHLPGARLDRRGSGWALALPATWFEDGSTRG